MPVALLGFSLQGFFLRSDTEPFRVSLPSCRWCSRCLDWVSACVALHTPTHEIELKSPRLQGLAPRRKPSPWSAVLPARPGRCPPGLLLPSRVLTLSATIAFLGRLSPLMPFFSLHNKSQCEPGLQSLGPQRDWLALGLPTLLGFSRHGPLSSLRVCAGPGLWVLLGPPVASLLLAGSSLNRARPLP
jgi:hypothetical protein